MFKINIDGRELGAYQGQTILQVAQENGLEIPTLCYDERLKTYGGCGLCVVEVEGSPKLFRACATEVAPNMIVFTESDRVRESRKLTLELLLSDHTGDCRGPCHLACPAHTDVQGYVGLVANGQYREAVALIKERLPLPASIGRVCPHPCEEKCCRQLVDAPIAIANLKHYAADADLASNDPYLPEIAPETGKEAAVVGAGPAGLTAAYFLARAGHRVTVYDAMPQAGGMLRYGIPEYRLPKATLDQEIALIERMGVQFVYNTKIGKDISLSYLRENYAAVFVGIGAWESSSIRCKGEDLPGVLGGIDFLREVTLNREMRIGDRVAIVGGGNTAVDAARTAVRLGAKEVTMVYRRTKKEMPAEDYEISAAEDEGINFKYLVSPIEITAENGRAAYMRLQQMELGEPDASGRRRPVPIPGAEEVLPVDTVIQAIGQQVQPEGLDLPLSKWRAIAADEATLATTLPGVFAGGDAVTGPKIAIDAVAQGLQAAESMLAYLAGEEIPAAKKNYLSQQVGLTREDFADRPQAERIVMPQLTPAERCGNFREVNLGLNEAAARDEARRCLECGCRDYFECRLIRYAIRYGAKPGRMAGSKRQEKLQECGDFFERNSEKCILCGLCLRVCDELVGAGALGLVHRGFESSVQPEFGIPLSQSDCIECGTCVAVCPTGALVERYPIDKNVPLEMKETRSVCSFCSMGCEQLVGSRSGLVLRSLPVERGVLCRKGRFGFRQYAGGRVTVPLIRKHRTLEETGWEEARVEITKATQRIRSRYGSQALALLISPACTTEEGQAAIAWGRNTLGIVNIAGFTADVALGLDGKHCGCTFEEMEAADLVLMVGSFKENQVAAIRVRRAAGNGAKLVVVSSEATLVDDLAAATLDPSGSSSIGELLAAAKAGSETVTEVYTKAKKAVIIVDGSSVSSEDLRQLAELAVTAGKTGPRNGLIVVTPGANQAGLRGLLGSDPAELSAAIKAGGIKGLVVLGDAPAGTLTAAEMEQLEFLAVITPSLNETARQADLVLPGSTPLETSGSYLSCDGKVKRVAQVVEPPSGMDNRQVLAALS